MNKDADAKKCLNQRIKQAITLATNQPVEELSVGELKQKIEEFKNKSTHVWKEGQVIWEGLGAYLYKYTLIQPCAKNNAEFGENLWHVSRTTYRGDVGTITHHICKTYETFIDLENVARHIDQTEQEMYGAYWGWTAEAIIEKQRAYHDKVLEQLDVLTSLVQQI